MYISIYSYLFYYISHYTLTTHNLHYISNIPKIIYYILYAAYTRVLNINEKSIITQTQ